MSEGKITKLIYDIKLSDFAKRLEELQSPSVVYVSDMVYCPLKRKYRISFPHLTFAFEPMAVLGELVHKGLQTILSERGYLIEHEVSREYKLETGTYLVKGRIDAYMPGEVIEIKTSRGPSESLPYPHHLLQIKAYMELTGAEKGILIYISSDKIHEYPVTVDEPLIERLLDETLKERLSPRWDWECKTCSFAKICPKRQIK